MAVSSAARITAQQFFHLPEQTHTELINGEIVVDAPSLRHQRIITWLIHEFMSHLDAHPGGEVGIEIGVHLDDDNVFLPDVWYTTAEHTLPKDAVRSSGPPDLVIEVRSPSTWRHDVGPKRSRWEAAGLPELWLVDTVADTVIVLRRSSDDAPFDIALELGVGEALTTPLVPGLVLDVRALFDR